MTTPARLQIVPAPADQPGPGTGGWDLPVPLTTTTAPPPFPVDVLPSWLGDMVRATARFTQTDVAMAGGVALAVLSACAGGRLDVEARPGWREPVNLFLAVVAEPGERKSPVHGALTDPLETAEATLGDRTRAAVAEAAALKDIAARQAEHAKNVAAKATSDKRDDATAEALAAALAAEAITVPTLPRLFADDATPEKLVSLMADNGGRMAVISDEGGVFDMLAGRYSSTPNLDPYLKGHVGRPIRVDRHNREGEFIPRPALTVGVMIQPSVLRKFGGNDDLAGRGLVARFLFVLPASLAGWRETEPDPIPEDVRARYTTQVHDLAAVLAEWTGPAVVTLTDDAARIRATAAAEIERRLRPGGTLRDMREWANKLAGTTIRLAGLLHVAHHPADAWRRPVEAGTMADAVKLAEFFVAHYTAARQTIVADKATVPARYVIGRLVDKGWDVFTVRQLQRSVYKQLPRAAEVVAALDTLAQLGWVRQRDGRWETHPRAAELLEAVDTLTDDLDSAFTAGQAIREGVNHAR
ncbi:YfjI family protein [Catenuloplanes japonicus]|uniref:YfjI family protein n=1 Tax=Catenuloplanes japonicus TaxID=33876 RepID=UPI000526EA9F|nr:YfjI family protein [Catenuloplanes japonicus]